MFTDVSSTQATSLESTWRTSASKGDADTQTPREMYQFSETEMQSGVETQVLQDQVKGKHSGLTLLEHYCKLHPELSRDEWRAEIGRGKVTVDCEVTTKGDAQLQTDFFLEYVNVCSDKEVSPAHTHSLKQLPTPTALIHAPLLVHVPLDANCGHRLQPLRRTQQQQ